MLTCWHAARHAACGSGTATWLAGSRRWARLTARNIGTPFVPRRVSRSSLEKAKKKSSDRVLLLPPYTAAYELRIIFSLNYASVFRLLGVNKQDKKYYWKDYERRYFETVTKRKALFPFDMVAPVAASVGFKPHMVDPEPDWSPQSPIALGQSFPPVPVVAILGHINHGKTTLIDRLCGTSYVNEEPGNITQEVRAMSGWISESSGSPRISFIAPEQAEQKRDSSSGPSSANARYDVGRLTLLDTPGHEAFDVLRGRTIAAADVAVVVVSVERGAEVQTEEVLLHASKWKVPVVFALNKIDLPDAHIDLTRAELRRQCQRLYEAEEVDVDWTKEAEQAVPISALQGLHLDKLVAEVKQAINACPAIPSMPVHPPTSTPGEAVATRKIPKRTDFLVGAEAPPQAIGLVVEVRKLSSSGETVLTVIVRGGRLVVGHYFVVGTAMGRISHLALATGTEESWRREQVCESASTGVAVNLAGIKHNLGGDCAPDDVLYTVDRERAWRLSEYRRRIERLSNIQIDGPSLEVPWVHDGVGVIRTQAAFDRSSKDHVEMHSSSAYERRWQQPAVQDVTATSGSSIFTGDRRSFETPYAKVGWPSNEDIDEAEVLAPRRKSARDSRRFLVAEPAAEGEDENPEHLGDSPPEAETGQHRGRKSSRAARSPPQAQAWGAWSETENQGADKRDFVYYTDKQTWTEEAAVDSRRLRERWQWRDQRRWEAEEAQARQRKEEKEITEKVRREVFGEAESEGEEENVPKEEEEEEEDEDDEVEPLPPTNMPVISLILKTKLSTQFDVIMDEMESLQERYGVRVAIVHGGLGPVIPRDVTHAEVEKYYGFCPIYAFQVGSHPQALGSAERERIDIRRFDVFTDLVADVEARCNAVHYKAQRKDYVDSLSAQPTRSRL